MQNQLPLFLHKREQAFSDEGDVEKGLLFIFTVPIMGTVETDVSSFDVGSIVGVMVVCV